MVALSTSQPTNAEIHLCSTTGNASNRYPGKSSLQHANTPERLPSILQILIHFPCLHILVLVEDQSYTDTWNLRGLSGTQNPEISLSTRGLMSTPNPRILESVLAPQTPEVAQAVKTITEVSYWCRELVSHQNHRIPSPEDERNQKQRVIKHCYKKINSEIII